MIRYFTFLMVSLLLSVAAFSQTAVCPQDTIMYIKSAKSTGNDTLELDPTFTNGVSQFYSGPQDITIDGVRFYGYKSDTVGGSSMYLTVEIRNANQDSVPGNNLYVIDSVLIDTADSLNGPFGDYAHEVVFNTPITVNGNYTVAVKTNSNAPNFHLFHTLPGDGDEEWLCSFSESGWIRSHSYPGGAFDADFFVEPIVRYNLNPSFINDPECLFDELGDTVQFYNEDAIIVDDDMYNRYAAFGLPNGQTWNFGDGSPVTAVVDPLHFYPTNGPFAATMTVKILSWTQQICQETVTQIIKEKPKQDFSYTTDNLDVNFTNKTFGVFTNIMWDFGDGNSSQSEDPFHKYSQPGTYWVCQSMMTSCGQVTQCKNVAVATNTALNCGKDSVRFTAARGTDTRSITLRNPVSGQRLLGVGQRFDAPQSMIVHGFSFYANHTGLFRDSYEVNCNLWLKTPNNIPDTAMGPLGVSTVHINKYEVDTNYNDTLKYTAIFDNPVNLQPNEDYVLTIEYDSTTHIQIMTNDYSEGDGDQDLLAVGKVNDTLWVTAAAVGAFNVNGQPFDADVHIEPIIEYNMDANFSWPFDCMNFNSSGTAEVQFTDLSSRIVRSAIYNTLAFNNSNLDAFEWDFGDSTGITKEINAIHVFEAPGPFDVSLTIKMEGWTNDCQNTQVLNVPVPPTGGFEFEQVTSTVKFIDLSHNADEYWWTFSDSTYSSLSDPTHYFTRLGKFGVCQYVSNVCGSDTTCDSITVNVIGIPEHVMENLSIYPNPASNYIQIDADLDGMGSLSIDLMDLSGRVVRTFKSSDARISHQLYVGDLARGSYIMRLRAGEYTGTKKFILSQ